MSTNEEKKHLGVEGDASNDELKKAGTDKASNDEEGKGKDFPAKRPRNALEGIDSPFFLNQDGTPKKEASPWLKHFRSHFNLKDLKVLFKCSIAVWIYSLFIFINPTLRTFGQTTFLVW